MAILSRFYCMFGKHERSRGKARKVNDVMRSVCRGCGVPMVRDPLTRVWHVEAVKPAKR